MTNMTKQPRGGDPRKQGSSTPANTATQQQRPALWKSLLISLTALVFFFGIIEGGLFLFGVQPTLRGEDPFVGFSSQIPLFIEKMNSSGRSVMTTAQNKLTFFNMQQFPGKKPADTYRIFCMGGSTTYGRPYGDKTSFAGWLRELLPAADGRLDWEVINAGGVSYASYRVARLMEELAGYEPDLFIIYSGHNEFLEERTYGAMRDIPETVRTAASILARTRTWTAMSILLDRAGVLPETQQSKRVRMAGEVTTILARSAGPEKYRRDDPLRDNILEHYRISLERMADIARAAGAGIIFVTPASNLKDSSPFKSQHTDGLAPGEQEDSGRLLTAALQLIEQQDWSPALEILDRALAVDPRYADLHYYRGKVLFALGRYAEAAETFRRARDEDVCPLRAMTSMRSIVAEVAEKKDAALVDFIDLLEDRLLEDAGHDIPGAEYFLDHVHPTIDGNGLLAVELVEMMAARGIVQLSDAWDEEAIAAVAARIECGIDRKENARALINLAKVLSWAGKYEDAARLVREAMTYKKEAPEAYNAAVAILASIYQQQGEAGQALQNYRSALHLEPESPLLHLQYGLTFVNEPYRQLELAAAHILFAMVFGTENDMAYMTFGLAMAERGRYPLAYSALAEAVRINPQNAEASSALDRLSGKVSPVVRSPAQPKVTLERFPSGRVSKIIQVRADATGRYLPHGIWTEWYETGEVKRFIDYAEGAPHGKEITWSPEGEVVSQRQYRHGKLIAGRAESSPRLRTENIPETTGLKE
jgi:tetratricopeptide (TPR) repeat protein